MTDHEVMQMALEALEFYQHRCNQQGFYSVNKQPLPIKAITQLRNQLAKPQGCDDKSQNAPPEDWDKRDKDELLQLEVKRLKQLIAADEQTQGEWVDLTDEEKRFCFENCNMPSEYADAVIAKFKDKNTPPNVPQGEPVALETVYETIIAWDEGGKRSRRELARRIAALYTTPPSVEAMRIETLEKAANLAYVVCAETRHVTLGDKCAAAIRSMK